MKKNKLRNFKNALKDWTKIIVVIIIGLLINTFPIIISIMTGNWWFMFLYIIVPIVDGIYLIILKGIVEIFRL